MLPCDCTGFEDGHAEEEPGNAPVEIMGFCPVQRSLAGAEIFHSLIQHPHIVGGGVGQALGLPVTLGDGLAGGFGFGQVGVQ